MIPFIITWQNIPPASNTTKFEEKKMENAWNFQGDLYCYVLLLKEHLLEKAHECLKLHLYNPLPDLCSNIAHLGTVFLYKKRVDFH